MLPSIRCMTDMWVERERFDAMTLLQTLHLVLVGDLFVAAAFPSWAMPPTSDKVEADKLKVSLL